jgi:pimeloyl-ACP methyl ester carboxylesterase
LKGPLVVLEKLIIEGAGHWVQQERPDEVNAALIDFLRG